MCHRVDVLFSTTVQGKITNGDKAQADQTRIDASARGSGSLIDSFEDAGRDSMGKSLLSGQSAGGTGKSAKDKTQWLTADSIVNKLSKEEMKGLLAITAKMKKIEVAHAALQAEKEDLAARLQSVEGVKDFLLGSLKVEEGGEIAHSFHAPN